MTGKYEEINKHTQIFSKLHLIIKDDAAENQNSLHPTAYFKIVCILHSETCTLTNKNKLYYHEVAMKFLELTHTGRTEIEVKSLENLLQFKVS
jgi:hypothetical protein